MIGFPRFLEALLGPMLDATSACHGTIIDQTHSLHYGIHYADMAIAARSMAVGATFIAGRATQATTGADSQTVVLADGTALAARLLVGHRPE